MGEPYSDLAQTVADGCQHTRNFWRTQLYPITPKIKWEPWLRIREKHVLEKWASESPSSMSIGPPDSSTHIRQPNRPASRSGRKLEQLTIKAVNRCAQEVKAINSCIVSFLKTRKESNRKSHRTGDHRRIKHHQK